jgi:adenine-specific DNA-methyltransferase
VAKRSAGSKAPKNVEALRHTEDKRRNIPTVEYQSVLAVGDVAPREVRYPRNTDLDPQLVWRGKDYQNWSDLVVQAPPLYIQEKVHPKVLIDDLLRESKGAKGQEAGAQIGLFADFNGVPEGADRTDFYQHDQNWTNRMILGDSLQVMASLAEREGLRGKVQCIYIDPPYGIKFNSNFQWSTTSRDVKDGKAEHITREPEQVKAFRDTWKDGIHSYLTYLRDRLTVARDLLSGSGSVFVQIGDENTHRVRSLLDEVFGDSQFRGEIKFKTTGGHSSEYIASVCDTILWYGRSTGTKYRPLYFARKPGEEGATQYKYGETADGVRASLAELERLGLTFEKIFQPYPMVSMGASEDDKAVIFRARKYSPTRGRHWSVTTNGTQRIVLAGRVFAQGENLRFAYSLDDYPVTPYTNVWTDTQTSGFGAERIFVVQTLPRVVERCIAMTTDPGDLVLDPTCGSGTTAFVAEQWGRRWITIDTSRVALALARARIMGARYPYYLLADSADGLLKEAEVTGRAPFDKPTYGNVRHGFVYERVPHITLKSIANNAEIDVIYDEHQPKVQAALDALNAGLRGQALPFRVTNGGREGMDVRFDAKNDETFTMPSGEIVSASQLLEWEVPREPETPWPSASASLFSRLQAERLKGDRASVAQITELLRGINQNLKRNYTLDNLPERAADLWPETAVKAHAKFWEVRIARQKAIDASIAAKAEFEYLYDRPYDDKKTVRVAGPSTVESISPHRTLGVDENDELIDPLEVRETSPAYGQTFEQMILENLRVAGVQQAHKADRITFSSLTPWPGEMICAEGRYREGETGSDPSTALGAEKRAAIFIGPEFGTVQKPDLVKAAREAGDAGFDVLIGCAFNYDAHASEFGKLGRIPVLKARMNADLHMGGELKATGKGNLFVVFGEPDIDILHLDDGTLRVHVKGVDVFDPTTGEVRSDGADGIACWFIDTDYNEESFFVRHAYFLGQNDPYGALKTTLRAEIDADTWSTLNSDISRPFPMPKSGRIAVKVINHLGDEVMKVFRVE